MSMTMKTPTRPVMTSDQLRALSRRILDMTTVDVVNVRVSHAARVVTRLANNHVLTSDDGEALSIQIDTMEHGPPNFSFLTNQFDDDVLEAGVRQCEALIRAGPTYTTDAWRKHEVLGQDTPTPVALWHDTTVQAMTTMRETVIPTILDTARREQFRTSGFIGLMARAEAVILKDGNIHFAHDETDSEVNVTVRSRDGKSMGWSGQAARDWSLMDPRRVTQHAIEVAQRSADPIALEPGRRTAILTPAAVAQMLRYFADQWYAKETDGGRTALSKSLLGGNKLRQRILDPRFTMRSDPADPAGGYAPYMPYSGVATPAMTWVENGVLTNLAYSVDYAMERGKQYASIPFSFHLSGGDTSLDQMIAVCKEGVFVNRVANVELVDKRTCLLTGVTQGGCFLVKDGKITKAIKNFRFLDSPFFFMNNVVALGAPERAAFGYTPQGREESEWHFSLKGDRWPRPPIIVPPMMVRDFNFSSLADVV